MISIHTLRMEGDTLGFFPSSLRRISIHTLRMEGDVILVRCRRPHDRISIHTLRMEGDSSGVMAKMANRNFNPHPPRGG